MSSLSHNALLICILYFSNNNILHAEQNFERSTALSSYDKVDSILKKERRDDTPTRSTVNYENGKRALPFNLKDDDKSATSSQECQSIDEIYEGNENYEFVIKFRESFSKLMKLNNTKESGSEKKMEAVYFVGNTGSGKSTTVQIIAADNKHLYSKETYPHSVDYIIVDEGKKIGHVDSHTLFPDLIFDNETKYVLCDCPGFGDTRSQIHEIIKTYFMRKALQNTSKLKIAIVVTHAALLSGNYRTYFLTALGHVSEMFKNIDKYKNSFYLISSKTENQFNFRGGRFNVKSDETIISSIGNFLLEVRTSLNQSTISSKSVTERENMIKIIDTLLETKDNKTFHRISLLRRPIEEGSLSDNSLIQKERSSIREMLLNDDNMVTANDYDFRFPLSADAILYLNQLFRKMNSFMSLLSKAISKLIVQHYVDIIESLTDINFAVNYIKEIQRNFTLLFDGIKNSQNPKQFMEIVNNFSEINKLHLCCVYNFSDIINLHEYLSYLENCSKTAKYFPSSWDISRDERFSLIYTKQVQYDFLMQIFKLLTTYDMQINRNERFVDFENKDHKLIVNKQNIVLFLEKLGLKMKYSGLITDDKFIRKLNNILNVTIKHALTSTCETDTLVISDYIILLSHIDISIYESCSNAKEIVMQASHTIFLDRNLTDHWFKGKRFTIIAPVWNVIGVRKISVDGVSYSYKLRKAPEGQNGKQGQNGEPGGTFTGLSLTVINGWNLEITANGGNGQDGQDGGDGENGVDGADGDDEANFENYTIGYFVTGSAGTPGTDSGAGGFGGFGGKKGSITLYTFGNIKSGIITEIKDGKQGKDGENGLPGIGGSGGCDKIVTETLTWFLFVPIRWPKIAYVNCKATPVINGNVSEPDPRIEYNNHLYDNNICYNCIFCENINRFLLFIDFYRNKISDGVIEAFIAGMETRNDFNLFVISCKQILNFHITNSYQGY